MIEQLVEQIQTRFAELEQQMSDPEVIGDRERYAEVGREYRELGPARALAGEYMILKDDLEGARELLAEGEDEELRGVVDEAPERIAALEEEIRLAMVERDPNDDKNVIVEIRAGTGGDEAALFAGDLYKMLTRYAELRGFATEVISQSASEVGGFKEVTLAVKGDGAYSVFKYEGGTHRVQRVPETESQGRIHTSTATVAVLPEAEEVDVKVDPGDLQIDVYRSSGPGGQSVNTTDSAVRITHKPSGIVVSMQDEKSQLQNKDKAMRVLRARLYERALEEQRAEIAAERKAQVGSGERSEKVRTYNFPQGRVTDHRIKHTSHNLDGVLGGELSEFTDALSAEEKRRAVGGRGGWQMAAAAAGMEVREALDAAIDGLTAAGVADARLDAELLLSEAMGCGRAALVADPGAEVPPAAARAYGEMVRRRLRREPVAYILGRKGFRQIELAVDRRVLVPRPETELLVEVALEREPARLLDVGTGSGAIALAVATSCWIEVLAIDTSPGALEVALANAARLGLAERVQFVEGTLPVRTGEARWRAGPARPWPRVPEFDLILANLPYIAESDWPDLQPEVREWEPRAALLAGPDGLDAYRALLAERVVAVCRAERDEWRPPAPPATVAVEVGVGQAAAVGELMRTAGYQRIEVRSDLAGIDRVVLGVFDAPEHVEGDER